MVKPEKLHFTATEYLALERKATEKHEFAFSERYSTDRASARHVALVGNITGELGNRLRHSPARIYSAALRLCVEVKQRYTYPDVMVVCNEPQFLDKELDTLLNPDLIVEVLSESTRNYDRGDKFQQYRGIPSLREYLLVDQAKAHVERYAKQNDGTWSLWETDSLNEVVQLESIKVTLPLSEIYFKIDFETSGEPAV